jgi:c-di-GMP-binding flagellar brake protein YcgR
MRRLAEGQPAVLDLTEEAIDCRVVAIAGDEATLAPLAAADAAYIPTLGRAAALAFDSAGARVRIRGAVHRHREEDRLRFIAGGGAGLPARRRATRAAADLAVEATPVGAAGEPAGEAHRLRTTDVSIAGIGVRVGDWPVPTGELLELRIELPAGPPVAATARVLRRSEGVAGLEFSQVAPVDQARLAAFLIAGRVAG